MVFKYLHRQKSQELGCTSKTKCLLPTIDLIGTTHIVEYLNSRRAPRSLAWARIISPGYDSVQTLTLRSALVGFVVKKIGTEACFSPYIIVFTANLYYTSFPLQFFYRLENVQ
jgi:hypothetical protein